MKRGLLTIVALILFGCGGGGGGGGDGDAESGIPGIWSGNLQLVRNTCPFTPEELGLSSSATPDYEINQSGTQVVVKNIATGSTASGQTTDGGTGFAVATPPIPVGQCVTQTAIVFSGADDGNAGVGLQIDIRCPAESCSFVYGGTAEKH